MLTSATWEKACGKLPTRRPGLRVVLLGQQADVVAQRQQPLEQRGAPRRGGPAGRRLSASQKVQARKAPSPGGRPSTARPRVVAQHEAVVASGRARSPRPCRARAGRSAGRKPTSGISSRLASSCFDAVGLDEGARARRRSPCAQTSRVDRVAQRRASGRPGPRRPNCSTALTARSKATQAITLEWVKCRRGAAHLPDALVGLAARSSRGARAARAAALQALARRLEPAAAGLVAARPSPRRRRRAGAGRRRRCRSAPAREPS